MEHRFKSKLETQSTGLRADQREGEGSSLLQLLGFDRERERDKERPNKKMSKK